MLVQATSSPDFVNYLTYLFCTAQPPPSIGFSMETYNVIRVSAALNLKTKLRVAYNTVSPNSLAYIQSSAWIALQDPAQQVRVSAGTIITEIVKQGGLLAWPNLLEDLLSLVANSSGSIPLLTQEAAMSALSKVCEDNRRLLDKEFQGQRPLDIIIPKLMEVTISPSSKIRATVLSTVLMFMSQRPQALIASLDRFLAELFRLANDPSTDVRRTVCQAFVQLVDVAPEKLVPHMDGLVNYVLLQQHSPEDPELALDAAEFWLVVGAQKQLQDPLVPHLGRIMPILLQSMVYDEDDALVLADDADDADEEDRAEDLKPQFAKSKGTRLPTGKTGDGHVNGSDGARLMPDGGAGE